jgi:hypothetical protein
MTKMSKMKVSGKFSQVFITSDNSGQLTWHWRVARRVRRSGSTPVVAAPLVERCRTAAAVTVNNISTSPAVSTSVYHY